MTTFTLHTSTLFDPRVKTVRHNTSIVIDKTSGLITKVYGRENDDIPALQEGDLDLRGKYVMPGLVDAHTHVFLHSYE